MKAYLVKSLFDLEPTTEVKTTIMSSGQDPWVLYERKYFMKTTSFENIHELFEALKGKKLLVMDVDDQQDESTGKKRPTVAYYEHKKLSPKDPGLFV